MFTLADVIQSHLKEKLDSLYTVLPGYVEAVKVVDGGGTVVDVQTGVNFLDRAGNAQKNAVIKDVPLVWPSSGGCYITTPIEIGDTVLIHFAMRNSAEWKNSGGDSPITPFLQRQHSVNDAFATPSMLPYGKAPKVDSEAVKIASTGTEIRILKDGTIELGEGATEAIIKGNAFKTYFDSLVQSVMAHTHTFVQAPAGTGVTDPSPDLVSLEPLPDDALSEVSKTK